MISRLAARALCAAVYLLFAAGSGAAAAPAPKPSPSPTAQPLRSIAHVVTSDRSSEALDDAARTTYVVTRAQIVRYGYRTIADALITIPGVNLVRYGPTGASMNLNIRGSSAPQVLVLVNGIPAPGTQLGDVDLNTIPTAGVERIEVVEGGGSTLYGAGSVGGIVNIITAQPQKTFADLYTGTFDTSGVDLQTPYVTVLRTTTRNERPNSDSQTSAARVNVAPRVGSIDAALSAGMTAHHLGVPGPDDALSLTSRQDTLDQDAELTLSHATPRAKASLELSGTHQNYTFACDAPADPNCYNAPGDVALLQEGRLQASFNDVVGSRNGRTVYGFDLARGVARVDDGAGDPIAVHAFAQSALYAQRDWTFPRGDRLYAGLRGERDGAQGGAISPSLGAIVRLSPAFTAKANIATAFRAPTADDLYYPGFSNPTLQVERTRVADLTLLAPNFLGGAAFEWFSTAGRNLIALNSKFVPENIGHASIQGFTFQISTVPVDGVYAKLNATNLYRAQDLDTATRIPSRGPVFESNLELGYSGSRTSRVESAAILVHSAGARGAVDPYAPLFDQPAEFSDLSAFVRLRLDRDAVLSLRGDNLGNERYAEIGGYPMPGRTLTVELSTR